jgi:hypothetical protein
MDTEFLVVSYFCNDGIPKLILRGGCGVAHW